MTHAAIQVLGWKDKQEVRDAFRTHRMYMCRTLLNLRTESDLNEHRENVHNLVTNSYIKQSESVDKLLIIWQMCVKI